MARSVELFEGLAVPRAAGGRAANDCRANEIRYLNRSEMVGYDCVA